MYALSSFWIGLEIPETDLHITIAFRDECDAHDLDMLKTGLDERIRPLLPLHFKGGAFQMRGTPPDIPAYNVFVMANDHSDNPR